MVSLTPCDCFVQRLTYEERMARRLLGADSATVLSAQEPEEGPASQVRPWAPSTAIARSSLLVLWGPGLGS